MPDGRQSPEEGRTGSAPRQVIVVPPDRFAQTAAEWIGSRVESAVRLRGSASLALSGGGTPAPVYRRLARLPLPWTRVHLYFGDERRVPPDHADSNFRMVTKTLVDAIGGEAHVHRMRGEERDGAAAAAEYEAELPAVLDVAILGMGADAHTASLFPGSPALEERVRRVLAVDGPAGGPARLTLTPPALRDARDRVVLVSGASKADVVAEVFATPPDPLRRPVQLALDATWILDEAAASRLHPPP